jgi:2-methylisocitrate lyase-like PEP mutase family enzyme
MSHAETLRTALRASRVLQAPGVYDSLSALLVERAGFEIAFLSGASLSFARFGQPDVGLVGMREVADTVRLIRESIQIPLVVDADTGFGNALNVRRTVRELECAGASAIQIEDQVFPKRCGHMPGKQVVSPAEMAGKVRAALDARRNANTIIVARTDALSVEGFESALERGALYLEAGADALFIEGPTKLEQLETIAASFGARAPLVHNLADGARSPVETAAELAALGYRIALYPAMLVQLFVKLAPVYLARLAREGGTHGFREQLVDLEGINALLGAPRMLEEAARYA